MLSASFDLAQRNRPCIVIYFFIDGPTQPSEEGEMGGETPILLILAIWIFAATWVAEIYAARLLDPTD